MSFTDLDPRAREILQRYEYPRAAMLPLLWLVQRSRGFVSPEAERWIGGHVGMSPAHVHEAVTFYNMIRTSEGGRRELRVCTSLPCRLRGAEELLERLEGALGIEAGETTPDGQVTLTEVECLCACEIAPMAQLDERFVGPLEGETVDAVLRDCRRSPEAPEETPEPDPHIASDGPVLSTRLGDPEGVWLDDYTAQDGYRAAAKVLGSMTPEEVTEEVKEAKLRGLGGAGFPAGVKWGFVPDTDDPVYLVVNADEGEPGTFKDRYLMERDPHALLEGMIISAYAIGAHKAYVYIRGDYYRSAYRLQRAIDEARQAGWLGPDIQGSGFDLEVVIHRGAGAYICGEETALLTSLEGGKGYPRLKPPFPAVSGLFGCPTIVNNVETLTCVPFILREGAERFLAIGNEAQGGTRLFCVGGHVVRPGVYEASVSVTLRELIEDHALGVRDGNRLKAVIPGGLSAKILTADEIDVAMDFDSLAEAGSMAGSGGIIVMDETTSMVDALEAATEFFADESCGQCSPCREGTGWVHRIMTSVRTGEGEPRDLDDLLTIASGMEGKTICVFADAAAWPVQSYIGKFRDEFEERVAGGRRTLPTEAG